LPNDANSPCRARLADMQGELLLVGLDSQGTIVVFDVCGHPYALDTEHVREVTAWQDPRPLPGSSECIEGVVNLRGEVIPVCDLARSLGVGRRGAPTLETAVVICQVDGEGWVGFVVDSVRAVQPLGAADHVDSETRHHPAIEGIVRGADDDLVVLLRPCRELAGGLEDLDGLIAALGQSHADPQPEDAHDVAPGDAREAA
jgi:chemotaxis signal transduction protein